MLPGGIIEPGESIENGAIREVMEETNIEAMITGIRAVRTGVRVCEKCDQTNLYIAFNMDYISGNEKADGCETSAVRFFSMSEVNELEQIVGLSKAIILNSHDSNGLNLNNTGFVVNNFYKSYSVYV